MLVLVITTFYFFLPAYFANMCPVLFKVAKSPLSGPINEKLFGAHKTWMGFLLGLAGANIILQFQLILQEGGAFLDYNLLDYRQISLFIYSILFGVGALTGDLIKSFFKRRLGKKPGSPFFPFDQVDFLLGAYIFLLPFYVVPWQIFITALVITPVLHFLTNVVAYWLGMKKVWW